MRLALGVVIALASMTASAKPTSGERAKASELVKRAIAKSQAGDHDAAIELYDKAYTLVPQPLLLSNIGSEYQRSGKKVEAIRYFCKYIAEDPNGANIEYATAQVKTLQIELGNDTVDGDVCTVKPKPKPVEKPPEPAVTPTPPAPSAAEPAPPADEPPPAPAPRSRKLEYTGLGVAGAGVLAFGVGVYYGLQAKSISDSISNHDPSKPWPTDIKQQQADGKSDETREAIFMIGGGIAIGAGLAVAYFGHRSVSHREIAVTPVANRSSVGVAVGGNF